MSIIESSFLTEVDWKDYLIPETNPQIVRYLKTNGDKLYTAIATDVKMAIEEELPQIYIIPHRNCVTLISIKEEDFAAVLDVALNWFLDKENYEECSIIQSVRVMLGADLIGKDND